MRWSKSASALAIAAIVALGAILLFLNAHRSRQVSITFDPPYPETNANGDPILTVLVGRIPCAVAACERLKVQLVLYESRKDRTPTTYWLGIVGTRGNERVVTQGTWDVRQGVEGYPDALVYVLDDHTNKDLRYLWRVNDHILLPLDQHMSPKVGNAAWGYMLSRDDTPYGPRTFIYNQ
jgi:hypothetical protein